MVYSINVWYFHKKTLLQHKIIETIQACVSTVQSELVCLALVDSVILQMVTIEGTSWVAMELLSALAN